MSVAPYQPQPRDVVDGWAAQVADVARLADYIAQTDFVPAAYRGKPAAVAAAILAGRELGVGPMTALAQINVIKGRPAPAAHLMRSLVLAAGHEFRIVEYTSARVTVVTRRKGEAADRLPVTWTMDDARTAQLAGGENWRKYPRAMLLARATAEACRRDFADVIGGMTLSAEEAADVDQVETATPAKTRTVRRTSTLGPGGTAETVRGQAVPPTPAGQGVSTPPAPPAPPLPDDNGPALSPPHRDEPLPIDVPPPLPETPPEDERPAAAENEGPSKLTSAQRATIMTQLTGLRLKDPPATRHRVLSGLLGRRVTSTNNLTRDDASAVIDTLARYLEETLTPLQFEELVAHGLAKFGG